MNIRTLPGLESYDGRADATWDSANGGKEGVTQYLYLYWRELANGTVTEALEVPAKFDSAVPTKRLMQASRLQTRFSWRPTRRR